MNDTIIVRTQIVEEGATVPEVSFAEARAKHEADMRDYESRLAIGEELFLRVLEETDRLFRHFEKKYAEENG